jgi:dTDP-4-dehydrorhamnose reductase
VNILVVGRGQLGTYLYNRFSANPLIQGGRVQQWWADISHLAREHASKFDYIINAAGKTDLKWCEENAREAFRSNVECPQHLAQLGVPLIHLSSGCVWDGPFENGTHGFTPYSRPTPASYYAWTKAACDALLISNLPRTTHILRPRQVFTDQPSPRNTLMKFLQYDALIDTPNSMTSAESIWRAVEYLISHPTETGRIWNIADLGITTPYEVGVLLAQAGLRELPTILAKDQLDRWHKPKRVDTVLSDPLAESLFKPQRIETSLAEAIAGLARNMSALPSVTNE